MTDYHNAMSLVLDLIEEYEAIMGAEAITEAIASAFNSAADRCYRNGDHMRAARFYNAAGALHACPKLKEVMPNGTTRQAQAMARKGHAED